MFSTKKKKSFEPHSNCRLQILSIWTSLHFNHFGKRVINHSQYHINVLVKQRGANSLPNDKILDWSKLKAFADDKINVKEKFKFGLGRVENIVGKG